MRSPEPKVSLTRPSLVAAVVTANAGGGFEAAVDHAVFAARVLALAELVPFGVLDQLAVPAEGLVFGLSSHRAEHWWFFDGGTEFDSDVKDPKYAEFYGPAAAGGRRRLQSKKRRLLVHFRGPAVLAHGGALWQEPAARGGREPADSVMVRAYAAVAQW